MSKTPNAQYRATHKHLEICSKSSFDETTTHLKLVKVLVSKRGLLFRDKKFFHTDPFPHVPKDERTLINGLINCEYYVKGSFPLTQLYKASINRLEDSSCEEYQLIAQQMSEKYQFTDIALSPLILGDKLITLVLQHMTWKEIIRFGESCRFAYAIIQAFTHITFISQFGCFPKPTLASQGLLARILQFSQCVSFPDMHTFIFFCISKYIHIYIHIYIYIYIGNGFTRPLRETIERVGQKYKEILALREETTVDYSLYTPKYSSTSKDVYVLISNFLNYGLRNSPHNIKPIICAVEYNNPTVVDVLLDYKIAITGKELNIDGLNALEIAICNDNFEIVRMLLDYVDNVEIFESARGLSGRKKLFGWFRLSSNPEIFDLLLDVIYIIIYLFSSMKDMIK